MNEMSLKKAFKTLFGKGIFEYHMDERMKEAHRWKNRILRKKPSPMVTLTTRFITTKNISVIHPTR